MGKIDTEIRERKVAQRINPNGNMGKSFFEEWTTKKATMADYEDILEKYSVPIRSREEIKKELGLEEEK